MRFVGFTLIPDETADRIGNDSLEHRFIQSTGSKWRVDGLVSAFISSMASIMPLSGTIGARSVRCCQRAAHPFSSEEL